jgi:hypothetical protein
VSTLSILLSMLLSAVAPASHVPLAGGGSLQWEAPAHACPAAATVAALVDQHLASRGDAAAGVEVVARAVSGAGGRWSVELRIAAAHGVSTRSLEAADCQAAAETVALAVALAIGPAVEVEPQEVPPVPDPGEPTPAVAPAPVEPAVDASEPSEPTTVITTASADPLPTPAAGLAPRPLRRRPTLLLGLGGGLTGGHVARIGAAAQTHVALVGPRWQVSLRADHLVRRRLLLPGQPSAGGLLSFTTGALEAGPVLRPGPLELPLLVGVAVGAVRARGFGSDRDSTRTVPRAAVVVGPGVRWAPIPRLALGLRAELSVALVRHAFTFGPARPLAATGIVAGHAFATIALRLP